MAHYRLTRETQRIGNIALYRIQATAPLEHLDIGAGDLGGWVQGENNLAQDGLAWVGDEAIVMDQARVEGDATVAGDALIQGVATIKGNAKVYDDAQVGGEAIVAGNAEVFEAVEVGGAIHIYGNAQVSGDHVLDSDAQIGGEARIESSLDILQVSGIYYLTLYRTEEGHSELPERLPKSLETLVAEHVEKWELTAPANV